MQSLRIGSTHQPVDLSLVGTVKISVEVPVLTPRNVELPIVGVHDLIQKHPFHKGQRSLTAPGG